MKLVTQTVCVTRIEEVLKFEIALQCDLYTTCKEYQ